jgi:pyruvate carboxylase
LKEFIVHGVITNIDFLQAVLLHPDFVNGKVNTRWVETTMESGGLLLGTQTDALTGTAIPAIHVIAAALADLTIVNQQPSTIRSNEPDPYSPWKIANGFRMGGNDG